MDPLDFLGSEELLRFFHCKKTIMSCMERPHTFLSQLRDHDLIPEDRYKRVSHTKSKESLKKGVYQVLDWLERERPQQIRVFWRCVFEETIRNQYPTLRLLRSSLTDGSFHFYTQLPEKVENEKTSENKRKELSGEDDEEEQSRSSAKKKRKLSALDDGDKEQPGPSSQLTTGQKKKPKRISFSSPLKKGEKGDIWTWAIFQSQLPVTCGGLEGSLNRGRLAKGEKCILFQKQWFTPGEFVRRAGKTGSKSWKLSIRCSGTTLGKLIKQGHLESVEQKGGCSKVNKSLFASDQVITEEGEGENEDEEGEDENPGNQGEGQEGRASSSNTESSPAATGEEPEQQQEADCDGTDAVFTVTCGALTGTLHKERFASGTCGRSIRTEAGWMSPVEFAKEASCQTDVSWKSDIKCEARPLGVLTEQNTLRIHTLLCNCRLCRPDQEELENQKNDDECFVCRSDAGPELVVCDQCPRAFHPDCHLPHVGDSILRDNRPWMCTFCVFKTNQDWRYSDELEMQAATSHQISGHMLECQYLLLFLCNADEEQTFALNPDLYVRNYSAVIKDPMWFEKVANKLQNRKYQRVGEFVSDVQLIFTNCAKYNRDNAEFREKGGRLKALFEEEFKKVFGVRESTADS